MITKKLRELRMFIADILWVAQAYVRGKVLRQATYLPKNQALSSVSFFQLPVSVNTKRVLMLSKLWNLRPLTVLELNNLQRQEIPSHEYRDYDDPNWLGSDWYSPTRR